jgi:hypothetical protein
MDKARTQFKWSVVENEREWQTMQRQAVADPEATAAPASTWAGYGEWRLAALALVIFLLLAGVWAWRVQMMRATVMRELAATMQATQALPASRESSVQPGVSLSPGARQTAQFPWLVGGATNAITPVVRLDEIHRQRDRVMAHVTVSYAVPSGETLAYRQTNFYRQTEAGWQRIAPDRDLMGPWQTLETQRFTIRYRPMDVQAVTDAAPRLDLLHDQMRRDFGLPVADAKAKLTIEVTTDGEVRGYGINYAKRKIVVPSPALLSVPAEMTDATVFYQSVVYPLTSLVVTEWIDQYLSHRNVGVAQRLPVMTAMRLWELWDDGGPLAVGRKEIVAWLYQNGQALVSNHPKSLLPEGYERLCRTYQVWGLTPADLSIPLTCNKLTAGQWSPWINPGLPTRLSELAYAAGYSSYYMEHYPEGTEPIAAPIAIETILEYIVATYGRAYLPRLLAALDDHPSLQQVLPAVFGISAVEFEAGWQAYLAEQYGNDPK